ncbi:MAG: hypothetical protein K6C94_07935 [Candidatus Gastranaerophilales bacterium]|nr:hypothetical protein [Candidatus Gastranaerophilales bacterium]
MESIKKLSIFSLIFGAISGFLGLLPFVGVLAFLMIIFCSSFIILVLLKKTGNLFCPDEKTGMLYGGLAGFIAYIGFSLTFIPLSFILSFIFKESYFTGIAMIVKSGFMLMIMLIFFIGILCAMMNVFSGLASVYFFNSENKNAKFTLKSEKGKNNGF